MTTAVAPAETILQKVHRITGRNERATKSAALQTLLNELPQPQMAAARDTMVTATLERLAGKTVDLQGAARAIIAAEREDQAIGILREHLASELFNLRTSAAVTTLDTDAQAEIIDYLSSELERVIADAREADATLGDATDATEAIRRGLTDAWAKLDNAVKDYDAIRTAQAETYALSAPSEQPNAQHYLRTVGLLADALDTDHYWTLRRRFAARESPTDYPDEKNWVNWLNDIPDIDAWPAIHEGHWPTADRHAYLRWAVTHAKPWVPSFMDAKTAYLAAYSATAPTLGNGDTSSLTEARAAYREVTATS